MIYQKEDGDGTEIVKALLEELKLDASEIEKAGDDSLL